MTVEANAFTLLLFAFSCIVRQLFSLSDPANCEQIAGALA